MYFSLNMTSTLALEQDYPDKISVTLILCDLDFNTYYHVNQHLPIDNLPH